jgi:SAM-dependent methyltransferase
MTYDNSKEVFLRTWPKGYRENWAVYGAASNKSEEEVVNTCLSPFYDRNAVCLEIGCGKGFWTDRYLANNFKNVIALDLLPAASFNNKNITYIEVPDRDFSCYGVEDNSVDFCWSFGVFCHLSLEACQKYLYAIYRKLKPGGKVSLFYSNCDRRPGNYEGLVIGAKNNFDPEHVQWVYNNYPTTEQMLINAGFKNTKDLMPTLIDTMIYGEK